MLYENQSNIKVDSEQKIKADNGKIKIKGIYGEMTMKDRFTEDKAKDCGAHHDSDEDDRELQWKSERDGARHDSEEEDDRNLLTEECSGGRGCIITKRSCSRRKGLC